MEKVKNQYECIVIFSTKATEEEIGKSINKVKDLIDKNAVVDNVDEWGKRTLAYLINKESEGYYVLFDFTSEAPFIAELERILRITDGILRYLVVKKDA